MSSERWRIVLKMQCLFSLHPLQSPTNFFLTSWGFIHTRCFAINHISNLMYEYVIYVAQAEDINLFSKGWGGAGRGTGALMFPYWLAGLIVFVLYSWSQEIKKINSWEWVQSLWYSRGCERDGVWRKEQEWKEGNSREMGWKKQLMGQIINQR